MTPAPAPIVTYVDCLKGVGMEGQRILEPPKMMDADGYEWLSMLQSSHYSEPSRTLICVWVPAFLKNP